MFPIRQSTATTIVLGPFLNPTDGITPVTGLAAPGTSKATLSKNGVPAVYTVASWTEFGNGIYTLSLSTSDTGSAGRLRIDFEDAANYGPVWQEYGVVSPSAFDFLYGATALPVNATQWGGTNVTGMPLPTSTYTAPPATATIAAAILATPANLLVTDASGRVTLTPAEHTLISGTDAPAALTAQGYTSARATKIDQLDAAVSTRLATAGYTAPPSASVIATSVLTDSTAGDEAVVGSLGHLVTTAPSWYAAPPTSGANATATAAAILATPANLLATNALGAVSLPSSAPSGYGPAAGGPTVATGAVQAGATSTSIALVGASLVAASGFYTGRRLYLNSGTDASYLTDPCSTHSVTGSTHTFSFAAAQRWSTAPALADIAAVYGV